MNFLRKLLRPTPRGASLPSPGALPLPYRRFSLSDWQASPERVAYAAELLRQPLFLDLLGMLSNARPAASQQVNATSAAILYGQRLGHDQIIASILAAATSPPALPTQLDADYDAANLMQQWEREGSMDVAP